MLRAAISELEASHAQSHAAAATAATSAKEAKAAVAAAVAAAEGSKLDLRRAAEGITAQLGRGQRAVLRCLLDGRRRAACSWAWAHWRHAAAARAMDEMVKAEVARIRQSTQVRECSRPTAHTLATSSRRPPVARHPTT